MEFSLEPKRKSLGIKLAKLFISDSLRRMLRRKTLPISIQIFNKAEALEKFKVKATVGEKVIYAVMFVNMAIPCTAFPVTNPMIYKTARKVGIVR